TCPPFTVWWLSMTASPGQSAASCMARRSRPGVRPLSPSSGLICCCRAHPDTSPSWVTAPRHSGIHRRGPGPTRMHASPLPAAASMLGLDMLLPRLTRHVAFVVVGTQALSRTQAVARLYPDARVTITGRNLSRADHFVEKNKDIGVKLAAAARIPEDADVVITVTTSSTAFYEQTATTGRLIVAVGAFRPDMAEISAQTLDGSQLYVDDMVGARTEAGDLLQASIDWTRVRGIVDAVRHGVDFDRPIVYKTVGCAAWDLAAARTALNCLQAR